MTSNKRWLVGLGISLAVLVVAAVMQDSPQQAMGNRELTPVNVDPSALYDEYDRNEIAASAKFSGELLRMRGTIDQIAIDPNGVPYLDFSPMRGTVRANFTKGDTEGLQRLSKGEIATVVCVGVGKSVTVVHLKDCRLDTNDPLRKPKLH